MEYSSLALAMEPVLVQVIFWDEPMIHDSPLLGAITVSEPAILKLASEASKTAVSVRLVIFTLTVLEIASGIVQE